MIFQNFKMKSRFAKPAVHSDGGVIFVGYKAEQQVIARFLDAVLANSDDVWAFVSKIYSPALDLNELREVLGGAKIQASKAFYVDEQKNSVTREIYVEKQNLRQLLYLRMIKDGGAWKIYGVEQA